MNEGDGGVDNEGDRRIPLESDDKDVFLVPPANKFFFMAGGYEKYSSLYPTIPPTKKGLLRRYLGIFLSQRKSFIIIIHPSFVLISPDPPIHKLRLWYTKGPSLRK